MLMYFSSTGPCIFVLQCLCSFNPVKLVSCISLVAISMLSSSMDNIRSVCESVLFLVAFAFLLSHDKLI